MKSALRIALIVLALTLLVAAPAAAYLDPATGNFIIHAGCQGLYTLQRRLAGRER